MGCDIHLYIEVKTKNGWELYSRPNVERNYLLFAKMVGVRNCDDTEPIQIPRGIPSDASYVVKKEKEQDGTNAHDSSYFNSNEIMILTQWLKDEKPFFGDYKANDLEWGILNCYLSGNSFDIKRYPEDTPCWIKDVRFVFWFDN